MFMCGMSHAHQKCVFQVCGEKQRFEKLMEHFRNEDNNIDFMVSYFRTSFKKANFISTLLSYLYSCVCVCYKGQEIEFNVL